MIKEMLNSDNTDDVILALRMISVEEFKSISKYTIFGASNNTRLLKIKNSHRQILIFIKDYWYHITNKSIYLNDEKVDPEEFKYIEKYVY